MRLVSGALLTRLARPRLALPRLFRGVVRDGIWERITESATAGDQTGSDEDGVLRGSLEGEPI